MFRGFVVRSFAEMETQREKSATPTRDHTTSTSDDDATGNGQKLLSFRFDGKKRVCRSLGFNPLKCSDVRCVHKIMSLFVYKQLLTHFINFTFP